VALARGTARPAIYNNKSDSRLEIAKSKECRVFRRDLRPHALGKDMGVNDENDIKEFWLRNTHEMTMLRHLRSSNREQTLPTYRWDLFAGPCHL
jgi:hypothetical protein